jgi:hypothetical protein
MPRAVLAVVLSGLPIGLWLAAQGADLLLPTWTAVLPMVSPELAAPQLARLEGRVQLSAGLGREVLVGHQLLWPDPRHRVRAAVPLGPALLLPGLLLAAGAVASALRHRALPLLLAIVLASLAATVETPLLLAAAVHDELLRQLSPASPSPLVATAQWLNHGGRWCLASAGAAALVWPLLGRGGRPRRHARPGAVAGSG